MAKQPTRVGIMIGETGDYHRRTVQGVARYFRESGLRWAAFPSNPSDVAFLAPWKPHGIIATLPDQAVADQVRDLTQALKIPAVILRPTRIYLPELPHVLLDDRKIGRMAAEHFWQTGYRQFACLAEIKMFSEQRRDGLAEFAAEHEIPCFQRQFHQTQGRRIADEPAIRQWLTELPKPIGILVTGDYYGLELNDACRELGLRVPEDVGLVGVDNDSHWCMLASPNLSSVDQNGERAGYEAARLLHGLLKGGRPPAGPILIEPLRVIVRGSSDIVLIPDPVVAEAMRYIREHADRPLSVKVLADALTVSRRALERRFMQHVNRTPFQEIRAARIARVRELLTDTSLTPRQIAGRCGFRNVPRMSEMFRQEMKISPGRYRAQVHGHQPE